jgi:hypothetical protein
MQLIGRRRSTALIPLLGAVVALGASAQAQAADPAVWLCKPGIANNPCTPKLSTTRITTAGEVGSQIPVKKVAKPKVDCFYVYPTVSGQPGLQATRKVDPEQRSIALYQAGRYSQTCRVFAPMYRQITLAGLLKPDEVSTAMRDQGYTDVRTAWREYLRKDNKGRGVVFVGHSQGTYVLRRLLTEEVDPKPTVRKQVVSALLLGGNVLVKKGKDVGGDFKQIRACRSSTQIGCVIAFSTFNRTPPNPSRFGRPGRALGVGPTNTSGLEVLCTNPAALGGGSGRVTAVFPATPFAPGTAIGALTTATGFPMPKVSTGFVQADDAFGARCSRANGANVLLLSGADALKTLPDDTWGLHLTDANIALGDLAALVTKQVARYTASRG